MKFKIIYFVTILLLLSSSGFSQIGPGGIDANLTLWLDAKSGAELIGVPATNSNSVDKWVNKAINIGLTDLDQINGIQQPIFNSNNLNFNPVITFDGNNDKLNKSVLGSDVFDTDNNTIVMVHKYNSGVVYFKWEQASSGNRVGYEKTGNNVRFDFPTDAVGNQNVSNFNYEPNGQIVTATTTLGSSTLRNMGIAEAADVTTGSLNNTFTSQLSIGDNVSFSLGSNMDYAEVIVYDRTLNVIELNKVESYLAIKYGMTLGVNGVSLNYLSSTGLIVWDVALNNGYNFDIGGISRDDNSGQDQIKSKSINLNGTDDRDILTISNGLNFINPLQFITDASFFVWGHNDGALTNTGLAVNYVTDNSQTMSTIFDRVWKVQESGTVSDVTLEFDMLNSSIQLAGGTTDYNNVRLLVDEDGDFSNGATAFLPTSFDAINNLVYFQHDLTPTNGDNMTQNNGFYFTLAAIETVVANFAMNDTTICVGEAITFSDSSFTGPTTWGWTFNGGDVTTANTQGPHVITFNTPGIYDIILNVSDANSTDDSTLQIVVSGYPTIDAGLNDTICGGDDFILSATIVEMDATVPIWDNGITNNLLFTPLDSMMYFVTSNINGCESIDSVIIDLIELPIIIAPLDFSICDGDDTLLNVSPNPLNAIINWDNGVTNNVLFTPTSIGSTIYSVTSTLSIGTKTCQFTDETEITVNIIPAINAGLNDTICVGEDFIVSGINPDGAGLTWNNGLTDGDTFTPVSSLEYIVIATLNGCENSDTMNLEVNPNPELIIPPAITICDGESTLLNATSNDADAIAWDNGLTNNLSFTPLLTTLYTATATINYGTHSCNTSESVMVTVNPNPTVDADVNVNFNVNGVKFVTLCQGDSYTLSGTPNPNSALLSWTDEMGNAFLDGQTITPTDSLRYSVEADLNGCITIADITIDVVDSPSVEIEDKVICYGDSVLLDAISNQPLAFIIWDPIVSNNTFIHPLINQSYNVTASLGGCSNTTNMTITVVDLPDARFSFNPIPVTIEDTEVTFTQIDVNDGEVYEWDFDDNTASVLEAPIHVYPEIGGSTYEVKLIVTDSLGCIDSASVQITVFDVLVYYIPNAFTPDGDTYNETFQPVFTSGFDPYDYHLIIFNRWGETIFESFNNEIGWDGNYNGEKAADGIYVWKVEFGEILTDKKVIDRGTVILLR